MDTSFRVLTLKINMNVSMALGTMTTNIEQAINALREGKFVLIFDSDSREAETDMVIASEKMTPESIRTMRKDAGGLICTTVPARPGEA